MVSSKSTQRYSAALALLLIAGLGQSLAFRARRSDAVASDAEAFVPLSRPSRAAVESEKRSDTAAPQVRTESIRQSLASVRMNAGDDGNAGGEDPAAEATRLAAQAAALRAEIAPAEEEMASMKKVAMTALESRQDPAKVAEEVEKLPDEDKKAIEKLRKAMLKKAEDMPGVSAPLGFFDPLAFCADAATEGEVCFYREVEIKHGRVAMLASVGFLVQENFHPLFGGNIDVPSYIAFQQTPLQTFWPAVVAAIAIPETFSILTFNPPFEDGLKSLWTMKTDREPGDFGFDPLGLKPEDKEELKDVQTAELNNGRLAMIAAAGMIAQELATGLPLQYGWPLRFQ
jgi:hypothetical protein